jgi:hypothetical protein
MTYKLIVDKHQLEGICPFVSKSAAIGAFSQALLDEKTGNVCVLLERTGDTPASLALFNQHGELLANLAEPENFLFSYLTYHPDVGFAVVASSNEKVGGWYDWHFGVDFIHRKLFRHCPAY